MAETLIPKWFGGKTQPKVLEKSEPFKGVKLNEMRYEQLLDFGNPIEPIQEKTDAFRVILGNFVTTEDGTGIVHTAPSFGADDRMVAVQNGIGALTLVDKQGKFIDTTGEFSGRFVKNYKDDPDYVNVDIDIAVKLKKENKAFNVAKYEHNYPHCWRTDKPVLYYPLDSWFVRAASVKERMFELNKTINWKPASTGEGRFGKWLENLQDWNLSRSRFWGIPLPIWRTANGGQEKCISSIEELSKEIEHANQVLDIKQTVPKDLHRPYIDEIILATKGGEPMMRELDLIDVWFDSGSMPYAQWHYPFENKEKFERNFPADFIAEGVDQTRGWFYTLHAIATMVFDSVAYKNVVSNGLVLDKKGVKMSKRLGNAVDPFEAIGKYGADANRWYMIANSPPWDNLKYDIDGVDEKRKKFFGTLFNTYKFFTTYANIDGFEMDEKNATPIADRPEIDKWIISKLNSLVKAYTEAMDDYEPTKGCRSVENFVLNDLSNWYVRLCRRRFWKSESDADKKAAYETLYECMVVVSQLMASVAPFFADWLYRNLTAPIRAKEIANDGRWKHESIHLTYLTEADNTLIDKALEERMDYAQRISSLVLSLRKKEGIRVRQPLQKILLPVLNSDFQVQVDAVKDLILSEVNVKEIEYLTDTTGFIKKKIKPNFKTLGRKLGKNMKAAAAAIGGLSQEEIGAIEKTNHFQLNINDQAYDLTLEDFEITSDDIPGWLVANDGALTVAMDVTITETLLAEGTARELVNRIQNIRKDRDFNVTDKIAITLENHEAIRSAVEQFSDYICKETLATSLDVKGGIDGEVIELNDEVSLKVGVNLAR
ncbi:MAG TPA: isoleucine--tRNA ligase, partial [Phaeodactylibacter sp.]|nr:isoleucine--tRNA ligase [Phaeodactylibacter sp.]